MELIETLLSERNTRLEPPFSDVELAERRRVVSVRMGEEFELVHRLRLHLVGGADAERYIAVTAQEADLLKTLMEWGLIVRPAPDTYRPTDTASRHYLNGGWLEELGYFAALASGADQAVFGQNLTWEVDGFAGMNEVDVIARKGRRLLFVSCKLAQPWIKGRQDIRPKLREFLNEAAAMAHHFATPDHVAALMVSTDLVDEQQDDRPRYEALFGKARALQVELVGLDYFKWPNLVRRFEALWDAGASGHESRDHGGTE